MNSEVAFLHYVVVAETVCNTYGAKMKQMTVYKRSIECDERTNVSNKGALSLLGILFN